MGQFYLDQDSGQFFNDGTESGSTSIASVNANITVGDETGTDKPFDTTILIRYLIQEYGGKAGSNSFRLKVQKNGTGGYLALSSVSGITAVNSANLTNGDDCTQRIGSGSFVSNNNGVGDNTDTGSCSYSAGYESEVLFAFEIDEADVSDGDYFDLQVYDTTDTALNSYTNTLRVTVDKVVGAVGEIVRVDHEEGDFTDYDNGTVNSTDLAVNGTAAMVGSYGLAITLDGSQAATYGRVSITLSTNTIRLRYYLNVNSLSMAEADSFYFNCIRTNGTYGSYLSYYLLRYASGVYSIRFSLIDDADGSTHSSYENVNGSNDLYIEQLITRETYDGGADGAGTMWINGTPASSNPTGVENYNTFGDILEFWSGAFSSLDTGTTGTFWIDDIIIRDDDTEIGPAGTTNYQAAGGSVGPSGGLTRKAGKITAGSTTPTGGLSRLTGKVTAGTLGLSGVVSRAISKAFDGTLGLSGVLGTMKTRLQSVAGSLGLSGLLAPRAGKSLGGSLPSAGEMTRRTDKNPAGSLPTAGTVTRVISKAFSGAVGLAGVLGTVKTRLQSVAGSLGLSGVLSRGTSKSPSGSLPSSGAVSRAISKAFSGAVGLAGVLGTVKTKLQSVAGSLGLSGVSTARAGKNLAGSLPSSGAVSRVISKAFSGAVGLAGVLGTMKTRLQSVAGSLGLSGVLSRGTSKSASGSLPTAGTVTRVISKAFSGVLGTLGALVRQLVQAVTAATPDSRTYAIVSEDRSYAITGEDRVYSIVFEDRSYAAIT